LRRVCGGCVGLIWLRVDYGGRMAFQGGRSLVVTPEGEITKQITGWLSTLPNCWWMKIAGHGGRSTGAQKTGVPDLCIESTRHGRVWVEVKRPAGKLTESQEREIPKMEAAGAVVLVVRSLGELQEKMDDLEIGDYS